MENFNYQSKDDMLVKLELEKKDLERKIATPGMSAGSAIVWILLILFISNLFRLLFVVLIGHPEFWSDPETYCLALPPAIIGFAVLATVFAKSNNKSGLEEKLKNITLEIIKQERQLGQKLETPTGKPIQKDNTTATNSDSLEIKSLGTENLEKELRRIKKLLDDELITNEEYQDLRRKIMTSK